MTRHGRTFLCALLTACAAAAQAQYWPSKPVRLISPSATGTPPDIALRIVSERLTKSLGQSFVVDNMVGGLGLIAAQTAARAAPDGYTYLVAGVGVIATDRHMFRNLPYDPDRDFVPVAMMYDSAPFAIAVQPDFAARDLAGFVAIAREKPGKIAYGSGDVGVTAIVGQWFDKAAGTDMIAVPYKNPAQLLPDLMAGRTEAAIYSLGPMLANARAGKLRILAVTSGTRFPGLPDVPTVAETIPAYRKVAGMGLLAAPTGLPTPIAQRLNREVEAVVTTDDYARRLLAIGYFNSMGAGTLQSLAELLQSERLIWDAMLKGVRIEPQ